MIVEWSSRGLKGELERDQMGIGIDLEELDLDWILDCGVDWKGI